MKNRELRTLLENPQDENEKEVLMLLYKVMFLFYDETNQLNPFCSDADVHSDEHSSYIKRRYFDDTYFEERDFEQLMHIYDDIHCPFIFAQISDLLFTLKKNYPHALKAIEAYKQCFKLVFCTKSWITGFNFIKKAVRIACILGKNDSVYNDTLLFIDSIVQETNGTDPSFLSISLIELLIEKNFMQIDGYDKFLDKIIKNACDNDNSHKAESAYNLKIKLLKKLGKNELKLATQSEYAVYVERLAREHQNNGKFDGSQLIELLEKAARIYQDANRLEDAKRVRLELEPLKRSKLENMHCITQEIDFAPVYEWLNTFIGHRCLQEQILALSLMTKFHTKQDLEDNVLRKSKEFVFTSSFTTNLLDSDGRTIVVLPPIDMRNPKSDIFLLEQHMHREAVTTYPYEAMTLTIGLNIIKNKFKSISVDDLAFLIDDNCIIPEDRKHIFKVGIAHGLNGDYYSALHILIPQIENFFREIIKLCGGLTTNYKEQVEKWKLLTDIFNSKELIECYDENVLFVFRGLLNADTGANFRNKVAHGTLNSVEGNSGLGIYFFMTVIKLCSWYSYNCYTITARLTKDLENTSAEDSLRCAIKDIK